MKKLLAVAVLLSCAVSVLGQTLTPQQLTPPCQVTNAVPCIDTRNGNVAFPPSPVPHEKLEPRRPPAQPLTIPKVRSTFKVPDVPVTGYSRNWTYKGDDAYYHDDSGTVAQVDVTTLQNYANNQESFEASYQMGAGIGSAIGLLIHAWIAHHRRVDLQRKTIRQQIGAYYNATFDLIDETVREQDALAADYALLAKLDPARGSIYERGAENAAAFKARIGNLRPAGEKMLRQILRTKKIKYLRTDLGMAQKTYQAVRNDAEREFVFVRLVDGLAGYYRQESRRRNRGAR